MITLKLPWPPTANTYYRRVGNRTLISRKGRAYRKLVAQLALAQRWPSLGEERLGVELFAYLPDRRRRDLDNLQKCLLDALQHAGLYDDDGQIDRLTIVRHKPDGQGRIVACVGILADAAQSDACERVEVGG